MTILPPSISRFLEDVWSSKSDNPIGLHGHALFILFQEIKPNQKKHNSWNILGAECCSKNYAYECKTVHLWLHVRRNGTNVRRNGTIITH
jgi:hypothetical protein